MAEYNYAQPFIVISALVVRDDKVLLIKENHEPDKGKWNMPAGKLDVAESLTDGVIREVYEETGLKFIPTALLGVHSVFRPHVEKSASSKISVLRICFLGETEGDISLEHGDAENGVEEISDYVWLTPQEILDMDNIELRYHDIKDFVRDFVAGKAYPIDLVRHFVQV